MTNVHRVGLPVVVGVDGSESALEATRWAAREAQRRHVGLRLVNAVGSTTTHYGRSPGFGPDYREVLLRIARAQVAAAATAAAQVAPGVTLIQETPTGDPIPRLVAESQDAQLVVVGDRGLGGFTGLLVGSVAVALAAHAACPVVSVRGARRGDPPPLLGPVVVGVDGSPTSEAALAFAYAAADARGVALVAVHTWRDTFADPALEPLLDWDAIETGEGLILAERLAGWGKKFPDVSVQRVVTRDRPAHTLVEQSTCAQLVVVGSRGRGSFTGLVLGSVSHALLHHANCPVAIVRPAAVDGAR